MRLMHKVIMVFFALVVPAGLRAGDLTGVELMLPAGFQFVLPDPSITVDGSGVQLAAKAAGGVTLSISHNPDRKFPTGGIAGFFEEEKKALVGQSQISLRRTAVVEESGRTWGLAIIDVKSQQKEVQFQLVTSFQDTLLMFEFRGPKKREKFVESAVRKFMSSNPLRVVAEPDVRPNAIGVPKSP